jgi:hypothetical protein
MSAKITQQQADAAMFVYETFATDSAEVAKHLGVSKSVARTRLAALEAKGLCCADVQEDPAGHGLVNRGERVGEHNVWQMARCSVDDTTPEEAAALIFSTLSVWPTGHAPAPAAVGPSPEDIAAATAQLQRELSSPEFAEAVAGLDKTLAEFGESTPAATAANTEGVPMTETTNTETAAPAETAADEKGKASPAAKAAVAKARKARGKKTAAKKAPAVLTAKAAAALKPAASMKADQASRVGADAGDSAPGYVVRWPKAGYDLLLKTDAADADAPKWLVRCNEHGTTLPVSGAKEGDLKGRIQERQVWCPGCKKAAKAAAAKA